MPVKTYSAGMFLRLGFSIAAHLDADVLLIDEVLAVGDEAFQRKCLRRISEQIAAARRVVLVSHDAGAIERVCERVVVLDAGRVVFDGPTAEGLLHYHRLMGTEHGERRVATPRRRARAGGPRRRAARRRSGAPARVPQRRAAPGDRSALRAKRPVDDPVLALELRAQDGTLRVSHEPRRSSSTADGTAQLAFEVPELALLGGDYDIALGAGHGSAAGRRTGRSASRSPASRAPRGSSTCAGAWRSMRGRTRARAVKDARGGARGRARRGRGGGR